MVSFAPSLDMYELRKCSNYQQSAQKALIMSACSMVHELKVLVRMEDSRHAFA